MTESPEATASLIGYPVKEKEIKPAAAAAAAKCTLSGSTRCVVDILLIRIVLHFRLTRSLPCMHPLQLNPPSRAFCPAVSEVRRSIFGLVWL